MNFKDIEVRVNKPYPQIVGAVNDNMTVAVLKNLANGKMGELNASCKYVYQSVIANIPTPEIADILEEIGIVEMMHLEMLMDAIVEFGGKPKYEDAQGNYFTTAGLDYGVKLKDMLANNIATEQRAVKNYEEAIMRVKNDSLKNLFKRIIKDEERHIQIFKNLLNTVEFMSI